MNDTFFLIFTIIVFVFIVIKYVTYIIEISHHQQKIEKEEQFNQDEVKSTFSRLENSFSEFETSNKKNKNQFNVKTIKECASMARKINDCYGFTYDNGKCTLSNKFLQKKANKTSSEFICNKLNPVGIVGHTNNLSYEDVINNSIFSCLHNGKVNIYASVDKTGDIFKRIKNFSQVNKDLQDIHEHIGTYHWK